jgi:cyclopropane fatty-acyl-phospholipid synthase-like methyltransferase
MDSETFKPLGTDQSLHWSDDPWIEKFERIPNIYYGSRIRDQFKSTDGMRLLDFGCGSGLITTGLAAFLNPAQIDAVDLEGYVNHDENKAVCSARGFNYEELSSIINFKRREPTEELPSGFYDAILSWSVIEHISPELINREFSILFDALKLNGMAIFQSAPLYYSPFGSHFYSLEPWFHLTFNEQTSRHRILSCASDRNIAHANIECMETLNRLTHHDFRRALVNSGFKIKDEYMTKTNLTPPERLTKIFNEEVLLTEQVVFTVTK